MMRWDNEREDELHRLVHLLHNLTDEHIEFTPESFPGHELGHPTEANHALAFSPELYEAMLEADVQEAMREFELPHVVVCFSPATGYLTVEGPYEDGLTASQMAEESVDADRFADTGFTYLVLPLLPRRDQE